MQPQLSTVHNCLVRHFETQDWWRGFLENLARWDSRPQTRSSPSFASSLPQRWRNRNFEEQCGWVWNLGSKLSTWDTLMWSGWNFYDQNFESGYRFESEGFNISQDSRIRSICERNYAENCQMDLNSKRNLKEWSFQEDSFCLKSSHQFNELRILAKIGKEEIFLRLEIDS